MELLNIIDQVGQIDSAIAKALRDGRLRVMSSGSASPCLDLKRLDEDLVKACSDVDLVIIEVSVSMYGGM